MEDAGALLWKSHKSHPEGLLSARSTERAATGPAAGALCPQGVATHWPCHWRRSPGLAWGREPLRGQEVQPFLSGTALPEGAGRLEVQNSVSFHYILI